LEKDNTKVQVFACTFYFVKKRRFSSFLPVAKNLDDQTVYLIFLLGRALTNSLFASFSVFTSCYQLYLAKRKDFSLRFLFC